MMITDKVQFALLEVEPEVLGLCLNVHKIYVWQHALCGADV